MKKILLSACVISLAFGVNAQQLKDVGIVSTNKAPYLKEKATINFKQNTLMQSRSSAALFEEDFDGGLPDNWIINTAEGPVDWKWTDVGMTGDYPTAALESTTAANGWMMVDSDGDNFEGGAQEHTQLILNEDVDCSAIANVVVSFEQMFRRWQADTCIVRVSNDGGDTWAGKYYVNSALDANGQWYATIDQSGTDNPDVKMINISDVAGNSASVRIMFEWFGSWDYGWQIDDVMIIEQPANDLELYASIINMTDGSDDFRDFYGIMPSNQISEIEYGVGVYNFGVNTQTNVTSTVDVSGAGTFNDSYVYSNTNLDSDSSYVEYHTSMYLPSTMGEYINTFIVSADTTDDNPNDNGMEVLFSISDSVFAPYYALDAQGTVSTGFAADGFKAANLIETLVADELTSTTLLLNPNTVAGGFVQISVASGVEEIQNPGTEDEYTSFSPDENNILMYSEFYTITQADVDANRVTIPIPLNYNGNAQDRNLAPGNYFIIVECYSNADASPIVIADDKTYPNRGVWSSIIFVPGEQWYTNGEALGIAANFGTWAFEGSVSIEENTIASSFNTFPNPTNGITRFAYNLNTSGDLTITVRNIMGQVVYTSAEGYKTAGAHETTIDFSDLAKGTYTYELSLNNASVNGKLIIK